MSSLSCPETPALVRFLCRLVALCLLVLPPAAPATAQNQYWDDPRPLAAKGSRFVQAESGGGLAVIVWQEFVPNASGTGGRVYLSLRSTRDFRNYTPNDRFFGPIPYSEKEVPIFSLVVTATGRIYCGILTGPTSVAVLASRDEGKSFRAAQEQTTPASTVAPYITVTGTGAILLFVTQTVAETTAAEDAATTDTTTTDAGVIQTQSMTIAWSRSEDGQIWTPFTPFVTEETVGTNLKPSHVSWQGKEYLVFQGVDQSYEVQLYHLFLKLSEDGGKSWREAAPLRFSEFSSGQLRREQDFDNERPFIQAVGDRLAVAWERSYGFSGSRQVYYAELHSDGSAYEENLRAATSGTYRSSNPQILMLGGSPYLLWFDSRTEGGGIIFAERGELRWVETNLTRTVRGANSFGRPLVVGNELYVAWDNARGAVASVQLLGPDHTAEPPVLRAADFEPGRRYRRSTVTVRWTAPYDPSGIDVFSYSWDRSPLAPKVDPMEVPVATTSATLSADEDGLWYFHLRAKDGAGNWSAPSTVAFYRDTTPPGAVALDPVQQDAKGFLASNTFRLGWRGPSEEELAGYTYRLEYLGPETMALTGVAPVSPPERMISADTSLERANADNGTWALAVSAVDTAGNVGEPSRLVFRLNKYVPVTFISNVSATVDRLGNTTLTLFGRGFSQGGLITRLILDRDGVAPYDLTFDLEDGIYTVVNDRLIDQVKLPEIEPGSYRVGVQHPTRGIAFAPNRIGFVERGTVKLGDYSYSFEPAWRLRKTAGTKFVDANALLVWLVVGFLALLGVVLTRQLASVAGEARMLRSEVTAIIEGRGSTVQAKQERIAAARKRGMGLRLKFSLLMVLLVLLIVLIVSIPLSYNMIQTQRQTLLETLQSRIQVLMGGMAITAEEPFKDALDPQGRGTGEITLSTDLPNQLDQMEEATYVLIMGAGKEVGQEKALEYLWGYKVAQKTTESSTGNTTENTAGNRDIADFLPKDASPDDYGRNKVNSDKVQEMALEMAQQVDGKARTELQGYRDEIAALQKEIKDYLGKADAASAQEVERIDRALADRKRQIAQSLIGYKAELQSYPAFDTKATKLESDYEFVKPIVYTATDDARYVRGFVRIGVSTKVIQETMRKQVIGLIRQTSIIGLGALGLGILGAIVLASMTVAPIKRLARGVAVIRDTQDKEQLAGHVIDVRTRDEIGTLAQTINQMTQGLVAAAAASKDLMMGQEIQRRFISLDIGPDGKKANAGGTETDKAEIFGFYEGAATVSGDYFEYVKLDDKHYAIIKADVAGHGVAASLVMVELATLFSSFTRRWPQSQEKFRLDRFVYDVNDMLEVRGFKGRFAAFVVCILNIETGVAYLCNAGDNILHYFDGTERKMKTLNLPSSPASGVFPSSLVELQTGFQQIKHVLQHGDIFAFHTDGVEEDHRNLRDSDGNPRPYDEPDAATARRYSFAPKKGDSFEMIETERLFGILDACLNRSTFSMAKFYNPNPGEEFAFDFGSGAGTLREAVLAVIGMDKVFRVYRDNATDESSRIRVDRNVLELLRKHYVQFEDYFSHPVDDDGKSPQVTFSHLKEDEQFDDLTFLLVRRK